MILYPLHDHDWHWVTNWLLEKNVFYDMGAFIYEDTNTPGNLCSSVYVCWWLNGHVLIWLDEACPNDHRQRTKTQQVLSRFLSTVHCRIAYSESRVGALWNKGLGYRKENGLSRFPSLPDRKELSILDLH